MHISKNRLCFSEADGLRFFRVSEERDTEVFMQSSEQRHAAIVEKRGLEL